GARRRVVRASDGVRRRCRRTGAPRDRPRQAVRRRAVLQVRAAARFHRPEDDQRRRPIDLASGSIPLPPRPLSSTFLRIDMSRPYYDDLEYLDFPTLAHGFDGLTRTGTSR